MTRELDVACARAMGWTQLRVEHIKPRPSSGICGGGGELGRDDDAPSLLGNPADGSSPYPCARHVPRYSTDPATDAEKVAWLLAQRGGITIEIGRDERVAVTAAWHGEYGNDQRTSGATMTEALCNLVIAVAEAEARK